MPSKPLLGLGLPPRAPRKNVVGRRAKSARTIREEREKNLVKARKKRASNLRKAKKLAKEVGR